MTSNCSFRITRTTEDLAQTITALSQRLVKLEQRFEVIELQLNKNQSELPVQEIEMLDGIDQQIKVCQDLLKTSIDKDSKIFDDEEIVSDENQFQEIHDETLDLDQDAPDLIEALEPSTNEEEVDQTWEEEKGESIAA